MALFFPLPLQAAQDDVRTFAGRVAAAYAVDDAAALDPRWSSQSAAAARRLHIDLEQIARIECHQLKGVTIDSVTSDDSTATVRATIVRTESWRTETKHLLLRMRREHDQWRLTECGTAERALARELAANPNRWDALTRDEPELLNRDLALGLAEFIGVGSGNLKIAERAPVLTLLNNLAGSVDDAAVRAVAATTEAGFADLLGDVARSKERIAVALPLARQSNDAEALMRALILQSRIYERTPNAYGPALETSLEALGLADRVENRFLVTYILGNTGNLYMKQWKYAEAMQYFQRDAAMAKEIGDAASLMRIESVIGLLSLMEGDDETALVHLRRADEMGANDTTNDAWRGQDLINVVLACTNLGREREADEALRKAEELGRRAKAPIVIGETHRLRGSKLRRAHDYAAATRELEQALSVFESAKRLHYIPGAMSELALTRLDAGDAREALARAERCAAEARNMNETMPFIECRTIGGEAHRALGENDAALAAFREAIDAGEEGRRAILGDARQRARFLERVISPYLDAADLLADRGDAAAALEMTERAKGRTLLDILAGDVRHAKSVLTPQEEQREGELESRVAALNRRARKEKENRALAAELDAARAEYESYKLVLDAVHPRRKAMEGSVPMAAPADVAPLLGASTAIVEYLVSADHARAFVVTADRGAPHIESFRLRNGSRELDPIVARFTDALAHDDLVYRRDAQALYAMLLRPIEKSLHGRKAVCIIPDGSLWRLPFEALVDSNGRFVVESRSCFYAPSISVLAQVMHEGERAKAPTTLLAVGGPLKDAQEEARSLRSLYGASHSRMYLGSEATEENVRSRIENARVLHFATHAVLDEANPMDSEIVLARSGRLSAWEIMRLNLHAGIAVLSACDTARGRFAAGEGVIGFTWALFAAGCPSSLVSEWKVDSASTKRLMIAFHRAMLARRSAAEALRAAKLLFLRDPATRHPFYWSAFVLVGSPR